MKKNTQCLTTVGMFLVLAASCVLPVLADDENVQRGWQQEGERWVYINRDGARETGTWIKGADGAHYYLDEDGYMAVSKVIKDGDYTYYVDENGVRVKNQWASEPNDDICDEEVDTVWYYFDQNGRAYNKEGKALKLKEGNADRVYFFDSDGHMLSGWQNITKWNKEDETNTYYLGDEDQGYARMQWQLLEVDDEFFDTSDKDYDSYEFYYFGYDGKLKKDSEESPDNEHFLFDENGVMLTGWQPGVAASTGDTGVNRFYDEETGARVKGWLYAHDPDDENSDPHWFYCDPDDGWVYNEGGRDSAAGDVSGLAYKKIDGKTYFFDGHGHMITGLISTGSADIHGNAFVDEGFEDLEGPIGKNASVKPAGIYYLSQDESTLGQLQTDKRICLKGEENEYYYLSKTGFAYTNTLIKGNIYGPDGAMLHADSDTDKAVITLEEDIYAQSDWNRNGELKEDAKSVIPAGSQVIVAKSGKITQRGTVKINDISYEVTDYQAVEK